MDMAEHHDWMQFCILDQTRIRLEAERFPSLLSKIATILIEIFVETIKLLLSGE